MPRRMKRMVEEAKELHAIGVMSDNDFNEIKRLAKQAEINDRIAAVKAMSGEEIKALRVRWGMSQSVLAHTLGMSKESVSKWERNEIKPSGPALRILNTLASKGPEVFVS
ncbi:helix-turn-helix domain-containing protein [Enterobacter sp.]|uniref:helix-turn-helix domain-containing protein n=1 Tax=Enterobacter sp. TaxID=42895 RepID=UPI00296E3126|nr:helix-turn-helix domain-containing protein [Enterobacter sp.]